MKRFWDKVDKSGDCWEWTGHRPHNNYGRFWINGRTMPAHKFALELEGSDVPSGMMVCHRCDNRGCVNPDHLFIGTHQDNMDDMIAKGRDNKRKGETHRSAKLIEGDVFRIRDMLRSNATQESIARLFGVDRSLIGQIKRNKIWKHI